MSAPVTRVEVTSSKAPQGVEPEPADSSAGTTPAPNSPRSHTASASKIHYAGHKGSCATALAIPLTPGRHTWNPSDVTCKRCLTELRRSLSDEQRSQL